MLLLHYLHNFKPMLIDFLDNMENIKMNLFCNEPQWLVGDQI